MSAFTICEDDDNNLMHMVPFLIMSPNDDVDGQLSIIIILFESLTRSREPLRSVGVEPICRQYKPSNSRSNNGGGCAMYILEADRIHLS